jgi:hypothetical protein
VAVSRFSLPFQRQIRERPRERRCVVRPGKEDGARAAEVPPGTRLEMETVEQALDLAAFREALVSGIRAMRGSRLQNVMDEPM